MPSAANVKNDKHSSPDGSGAAENSGTLTPLRQAITTIEHKIRNLEKRKVSNYSYSAFKLLLLYVFHEKVLLKKWKCRKHADNNH